MLISVIVPLFRGERYISRTINSIETNVEIDAGKDIRYCPACFRNYHKLYPIIHGSLRRNCFCSNCKTAING